MSIFLKLKAKDIDILNKYCNKFEETIKKLDSDDKEKLLMYMYKNRSNLLMDLTETRNQLFFSSGISVLCVLCTIFLCCR